jgi:hypothetical protein
MTSECDPYSTASSRDLIRRVVEDSDRKSLNELLENRRLFFSNGRQLLLSEFLWRLRESLRKKAGSKTTVDEVIDSTYDLTLSKFSNLPGTESETQSGDSQKNSEKLKQKQIDCRNYYRVVLDRMEEWRKENPLASALDEEQAVGKILQDFVVRHFYLSRLEALRRQRPFSSRYAWKARGVAVTLWYPIEIPANIFREWLSEQPLVSNEDLNELRDRVQATIDAHYYLNRLVSVDDLADQLGAAEDHHGSAGDVPFLLARVVAIEKVNHIDELRPAIKSLGKKTLEQLILRIFGDLADERFEDGAIANDFGLSKATFSRFAGSQWRQRLTGKEGDAIPDLWRNTAKAIATDPIFLEAAQEAHVSSVVQRMLDSEAGRKR